MHRERPEKSNRFMKIYLVANNLQLHNAWNLSDSTELSGACGRYWGFGRSCLQSPEHGRRHENPSRSALAVRAGNAFGEPGLGRRKRQRCIGRNFHRPARCAHAGGPLAGRSHVTAAPAFRDGPADRGSAARPFPLRPAAARRAARVVSEKPRTESDDRRHRAVRDPTAASACRHGDRSQTGCVRRAARRFMRR